MTNATEMTARKMFNAFNREAFARFNYEESKSAHKAADKLIRYCALDVKERKTKLKESFFQKLLDSNVALDFAFLNNSVRDSNRFNVYAIEKAMLNLRSIANDSLIIRANKYDVAMLVYVLMNQHKESFVFNRKDALAMLSRAMRHENVSRSDMSMTFNVAASTASTQVSSSFRMLEALDVLRFDDTTKERQVVSDVNYDHALVRLVAKTYDIALSDAESVAESDEVQK